MNNSYYISIPHCNTVYCISSTNLELLNSLKLHFGSMLVSFPPIGNQTIFKIDEINGWVSANGNNLTLHAENVNTNIYRILSYIRNSMCFEDSWNAFHGSAIKINEKCYLFLAETHTGKTTLITYLQSKPNIEVITEDLAIVNENTTNVISIQRPLLLRNGAYDLLINKYGMKFPNTRWINHNSDIRAVITENHTTANLEFKIDAVILLNRKINIFSIDKCDDFNDLLLNSYCSNDIRKNICSALNLYHKIPIYKMIYHDLNMVYQTLSTL